MLATLDAQTEAFRDDVLAGLSAPIPAVPARWLYDHRGSELFDEITRLPTYYPTRTETALLKSIMPEIAARIPRGSAVVEFGAGSAAKTPILLEAITFDWDGYPYKCNNYRVYHNPKTDKITFIPSGMDQMFGDVNGPALPDFGGMVARGRGNHLTSRCSGCRCWRACRRTTRFAR